MTAEKTTMAFGWRVYGLGAMALGVVCLAWGDFDPGQPVPKNFPDRTALAYAAAAFMLVAGAAVEWRRTPAWSAAALTAYYALIVVILMNGRVVLAHYRQSATAQTPFIPGRVIRATLSRAHRPHARFPHPWLHAPS